MALDLECADHPTGVDRSATAPRTPGHVSAGPSVALVVAGTCNPLLDEGDGIRNRIEPPAQIDKDPHELPAEEA